MGTAIRAKVGEVGPVEGQAVHAGEVNLVRTGQRAQVADQRREGPVEVVELAVLEEDEVGVALEERLAPMEVPVQAGLSPGTLVDRRIQVDGRVPREILYAEEGLYLPCHTAVLLRLHLSQYVKFGRTLIRRPFRSNRIKLQFPEVFFGSAIRHARERSGMIPYDLFLVSQYG